MTRKEELLEFISFAIDESRPIEILFRERGQYHNKKYKDYNGLVYIEAHVRNNYEDNLEYMGMGGNKSKILSWKIAREKI